MALVRSVVRSVHLLGYFIRYGGELLWTRPKTRVERARWLHRFAAAAMLGLDVPVTVTGVFPERGAVIANHLGYLDIIAFAAMHPCVFCAKAEMRRWPLLGWMTSMPGTVYFERGLGGAALKAAGGMQAAADAGLPVVFFPEGTTGNGDEVLPFHSGLLAQAMKVDEPVTAAFVSYTLGAGNKPGVSVRDHVHYWGDVDLLWHIFRFMGLRGVEVQVRFAPGPIQFTSEDLHRKRAAVEARDAVVALRSSAP